MNRGPESNKAIITECTGTHTMKCVVWNSKNY